MRAAMRRARHVPIGGGMVDVIPLLPGTIPLAEARAAFELAADRSRATKVQLAFG